MSYPGVLILSGIAAMAIHEGGHFVVALLFGRWLKFTFSLGWIDGILPVPRFVWQMPEMTPEKQELVALAGFAAEFAAAIAMFFVVPNEYRWCPGVVVAHFALYPLYAGETSDFKWLKKATKG